jgi:acyl-CoA reductase-like NAD-dependent aldehyde dehydrogenase
MTVAADVNTDLDRTRFFIDGEWVDPRGTETHRALEAATGEPLGTAALGTDLDIDAAVKAARRALDHGPWGRTTAAERAAAFAIANDSNYGLGGSVWTTDEQRGIDVSRRVRTGTIGVNYYNLDLGAPFGGMKDSGIGRELGPEALNNYLEYKSIYASANQL